MKIERVSDHVFHLSERFPDAAISCAAFVSDSGVILVDTGESPMAEDLRDAVSSWGFEQPAYIISTHEHPDHVGCNAAFGPGPIVIAHHNARKRLTSGQYIIEEFPEFSLPAIEISDTTILRAAGEEIRLIPIPGSHSDSDLIVHFVREKVACLGDLLYGANAFPSVDALSGNVDLYPGCVKRALDSLPRDTVIIPGHSQNPCTWDDLNASHAMLVATIAKVRKAAECGMDLDALKQADVLKNWDRFGQDFTTTDQWIKYIWRGIVGEAASATVIEPLYHVLQSGTGADAVDAYKKLKMESPTGYFFQAGPSMRIVYYLIAKDRIDDALDYLTFMLKEFPSTVLSGYLYDAIGDCHHKLGNLSEAIAWTRRAIEYSPELDQAHARLAELEADS